ncbi:MULTISPECIES: ATP-binding cassette domain-containing protein [Microbacterium]|uniref:ATP-binding cassette domain-containing protein n=1 Tax=Microbacterium wangchenii TaxID=2541726 RepID=A0ABX5SX86_9MICO|nr:MULTISPECIES: ATP-binding cassette domain-containing protein [Microbacterium]MCK6067186.1 ATP-binding cassette domain-containing protein [Microbacterium sp. EYE_512]QBR89860.1 ATP-binding cassette domain-containing protein [Microbacterium wangchenii]TFV85282.1 ATP-binding cassette domain-containing protein [Microbacterium sp. dk485]TXK16543.1 ATP-binding cassette domain-containing protein [Microbacterium wangchenii]
MDAAISVHRLRKQYGGHAVLDGLEFSVRRGEVFALLGPNGAGKTTTISILTTLQLPDGGEASVAGFDVATSPRDVQQRIALTGQAAAVDDVLTGAENLMMLGRLSGLRPRMARERATELLARFDLTDAASRPVGTYSGGMRRRLDLALSLVVTPEVLFLDEPTTGLDTRSRRELWDVIRTLAAGGTTVFLTTQYLEEADQLADRVAVLHGGRIAASGAPSELKSRVGTEVVELRDPAGELLQEIATDGTVRGLRAALDTLDADRDEGAVTLRRPTLDDVFLALTDDPAALPERSTP